MCRGSVWPWPLGMAGQRSNLKWGELAAFQDESIHILCRLLSTKNTYYIIYPRVHKSMLRDDLRMKINAKLIVRNDTFIHLWFYYSTFLFAKSFFEMIASKTRDKSVMVMQFALTPRSAVCRPLGVPSFYTCISACPFLWGTLWSCCVCSCSRHGFCSLGLEVPPRWQNHGGSLEALVPVSLSLLFSAQFCSKTCIKYYKFRKVVFRLYLVYVYFEHLILIPNEQILHCSVIVRLEE